MRIAICDDEKACRDTILKYIRPYREQYPDIITAEFNSGEELISYYEEGNKFDVIFLDVEMKNINGLETGQIIRSMDNNAIISFLTNHEQYVFQSFKIGVFDYIIKPLEQKQFNDLFERITKKYKEEHFVITVKQNEKIIILEVKDIIFIESHYKHITYFTVDAKYETTGKLSFLENLLNDYGFLRCHHSQLVNMKYIKSIQDNYIHLLNDGILGISSRKKQHFLKEFNKYVSRFSL